MITPRMMRMVAPLRMGLDFFFRGISKSEKFMTPAGFLKCSGKVERKFKLLSSS